MCPNVLSMNRCVDVERDFSLFSHLFILSILPHWLACLHSQNVYFVSLRIFVSTAGLAMIGLGLVSVTSLAAHDLFSKGSSFTATEVLGSVSYLEVCFLLEGFGAYTQSTKKI